METPQAQFLDVGLSMPTLEVPQIQFIAGVCGHAVGQQRQVHTVQTVQVGAGDFASGGVNGVLAVMMVFSTPLAAFFGLLREELGPGVGEALTPGVCPRCQATCKLALLTLQLRPGVDIHIVALSRV